VSRLRYFLCWRNGLRGGRLRGLRPSCFPLAAVRELRYGHAR
jgi:hypothetical protein